MAENHPTMQVPLNIRCAVASHLGISLEQYDANISAGLKWCCGCRSWHPCTEFSGKNAMCRRAHNTYQRSRYTPKPERTEPCYPRKSPEKRFWKFVKKMPSGCWEWQGGRVNRGYGQLRFPDKHVAAHRFSWELHNGPIPDGLIVCHKCDNPPCVNPDHLFLGTHQDNTDDRERKGRGAEPHGPHLNGELNPAAKLTAGAVQEIKEAHASGMSGLAIGRQFGMSPSQIYNIVKGRSWKETA